MIRRGNRISIGLSFSTGRNALFTVLVKPGFCEASRLEYAKMGLHCRIVQGGRRPDNLSYLRCHDRVGAPTGFWIPTAVGMTGGGHPGVGVVNALALADQPSALTGANYWADASRPAMRFR